MQTVSIQLPESIRVPLGDTGKSTEVRVADIAKQHPDLIRNAALQGFIGALNNISRGKDEQGKALSDDVWATARQKKVDVWMQGDWAGKSGGGDRATTQLKEAYVDERKEATGATTAAVERQIKDTVANVLGKDTSATFANFMSAVALVVARRDNAGADENSEAFERAVDETRARFEAKYQKLADDAAARRAKAKAGLDVADLDF